MSNWGTTYLLIYAPDDIATAIKEPAGVNAQKVSVLRARGEDGPGGNGSATFLLSELATMPWKFSNGTTAYPSIRHGDIAVVYVSDAIAGASLGVTTFLIEDVELSHTSSAAPTVTLSGPDITKELDYLLNWQNIGKEFATTSALAEAGGDGTTNNTIQPGSLGSVGTTTVQAWHPGEQKIKVADNSGFSAGDPVAVRSSVTTAHHTVCLSTGTEDYDYIEVQTPPSVHVPSGSAVVIPEYFKGDTIKLALTSPANTYHIARLTEEPNWNELTFDQPLPASSTMNAGNAVKIVTGQTEPTSGNITQIMAFATSFYVGSSTAFRWTLKSGSESSDPTTSHVVDGASTLRLLSDAAEATGDIFRVYRTDATKPSRTIEWVSTPDASGVTLVMPTPAVAAARYASTSYAVMSSIRREGRRAVVTRITPAGGDDSFDIGDATDSPSAGFTRAYAHGAYVLRYDASSSDYMIWKKVTFPDIVPVVDTASARIDAANRLLAAAESYLARQNANGGVDRFYRVKCVWHGEPKLGQLVTMDFEEGAWDSSTVNVYISKITHEVSNFGATAGVRITSLELSEDSPIRRVTGTDIIARAITSGGGGEVVRGAYAGGGGGSGGVNYIAGDNIRLGGGAINLADHVIIKGSLKIPATAKLYMYDNDDGRYREIRIVHSEYGTTIDRPFLRFS